MHPYTNATVKCYFLFFCGGRFPLRKAARAHKSHSGALAWQFSPFLLPRAACVHLALAFCLPLVHPSSPVLAFPLRPGRCHRGGLLSGGPAFSFLSFPNFSQLAVFFDPFLFILYFYLFLWFYVCNVFSQRTWSHPCPLGVKQTHFLKTKILKWVRYT